MPLVSQTIKNLKGGISQQPDILRFPDQGQEQINGFSSEVQGLQKRPPTIHIKRIADQLDPGNKPLIKLINRDESERYYVVYRANGQGIRVFDLSGNEKVVNAPNGYAYLNTPNPRDDIRAVTVADYTFVVNRKMTVQAGGNTTYPGYRENGQALVAIKGGQYGRTYKIVINGVDVATYQTPDGSLPAHVNQIDTQYITQQLANAVSASLTPSGWGVGVGPNYIHIVAPSNNAVSTISVSDGFGGANITGTIFTTQRFNMLPAQAPNGYIVQVAGDPGSGADDYYIRYNEAEGLWKETARPGVSVGPDWGTMPHVLVREANGTFTFRHAEWELRNAGDDDSNPLPSFVGQTISDVFFFRNRLGVLSGESIVLTRSGEFFSFFPKSVVVSPDTDPVDVSVSHNRVSILNHAVPFAEELLLWSDQTQFVLRSDGVLSPRSVRVDQSTEFESAIAARPVPAGRSVYFAAPRASYTSIRRYYSVQDVSAVKNAEDISAHIPSYIPNGVHFLGSSTTENIVSVLTSGAENKIFLYKYLYLDEILQQQSWSHWEFPMGSRILACEFVAAVMYIIRDSPEGVFLEKVEFTQNTKDFVDEPYRVHADRKIRCPGFIFDAPSNLSRIDLSSLYGSGAAAPIGRFWVVRDDGKAWLLDPIFVEGTWYVVTPGNQTGQPLTVGVQYEFKYVFSKFLIKVQDNSGTRSEDLGRVQLRRAWVNYENTGPFTVTVCDRFEYVMSGKRLGQTVLGAASEDTGQFRFPLMTNAKECRIVITSSEPTALALIGAGWSAMYWRREEVL